MQLVTIMNSGFTTQPSKMDDLSSLNKFNVRFNEHLYNNVVPGNNIPYITNTSPIQRITLQTPSSNTATVNSKLAIDGKLVDMDVLTKLQQQQNGGKNMVSFAASKEFLSNLTGASKMLNSKRQSVISTTSKTVQKKTKKLDNSSTIFQPIASNVYPHPIRRHEKNILPKTTTTENCEVKKFAPEMSGLLTDLSTALKGNLYSNQITVSTSTSTFKISKSSTVYQSAKTTAKNFNQAKNSLLGMKTAANHNINKTMVANNQNKNTIKTSNQTNPRKRSPNYAVPKTNKSIQSLSSIFVDTPSYLSSKSKSYQQQGYSAPNRTKFYNLSEFTSDTHYGSGSNTALTNYSNSLKTRQGKHQTALSCQKVADSIKRLESHRINKLEASENNVDLSALQMQRILEDMEMNKIMQLKRTPPQLYKHRESTQVEMRKTQNTEEKEKEAGISGFSKLYETAVKNLLNIKAFPEDDDDNSSATKTPHNTILPKYNFENELDMFMRTPIEKNNFSTNYHNTTSSNEHAHTKPEVKLPSNTLLGGHMEKNTKEANAFSFTQLLESSEIKLSEIQENNRNTEFENKNFFTKILLEQDIKSRPYLNHGELPWLHSPYLYKPVTSHPQQLPYLNNPYFYYGEPPPKFPNVVTASINSCQRDSKADTKPVLISKPKVEEMVISPKTNTDDIITSLIDEEVNNINNLNKIKKPSDKLSSRRNTPTPTTDKKNKKDTLKYRPYRLRDRIKASKKATKLMQELQAEPKKPSYLLKDINKYSTKKERYLNEFGLRRIVKRISSGKEQETKNSDK